MTHRKVLDTEELKNTFRIKGREIERLSRQGNPDKPKWKVVENKADKVSGYCQVGFNRSMYMYHVILWILYYNENIPEGLCIDHINGNKIDNRIENLRLVTQRENCQNRKKHRDGELAGVSYYKIKKKYRAQIMINNKNVHIGYYQTDKEANNAYEIACTHIEEYVDNESFRAIIKNKLYT